MATQNASAPANVTPFPSASLYVGDLHPEVTESVLFDLFNRVGPVASIRVCRDSVNRRSLGYAYVNFHNVQDAERALDTMNFAEINNRPCRIMWSQRDPSLRKTGLGNVFVRNLAPTVDNKGLYDTFSVFGNILSCKVATDETGRSKGYGYVHFETAEAATDAIQKFDGMLIDDVEVHVGHFVRRQDRAAQNNWTNLYAKQFPTSWDEARLREIFQAYGPIASLYIFKDADGKSKGVAFINYGDHESASKAVAELNGKLYEEAGAEGPASFALYVGRAQKKAERQQELKRRQESLAMERINKFQGMNLYVKNIADTLTDEAFREAFTQFGTITSARIMRESNEHKTSKGFGFVCFSNGEEAAKAVAEMNGKPLGGKPLYVTFYQKKEIRMRQMAANYAPQNMRFGGMQGMGGPGGMPMAYMGPMYMQGQGFPNQGAPRGVANAPFNAYGAGGGNLPRGPASAGPRGGPQFANRPPQYFQSQVGGPYMQQGPSGQQQGMMRQNPRPQVPGQVPGQFPQQMQPGQMQFPAGARGPAMAPRGAMPQGIPGQIPQNLPGGPARGPVPMQGPGQPRPMYQQAMNPQGNMIPVGQFQPGQGVPRGPAGANVKFTNQARNQNGQMMVPGQMIAGPGGMMVPGQQFGGPIPPQKMDFSEALVNAQDPQLQKNMIGERLFPLIHKSQPELAGKITGMLLEMDNGELLNLIESPDALASKIEEALSVLRNHQTA